MIPTYEIILRLLLGTFIGGIIGFEREAHGRAAGFRTHLLVCVAAVLIMIISENYYFYLHESDPLFRIDPARISSGALVGIGFLGAGVIIKSGFTIRGLTTAASIWIVSAIGLAIGGGLYLEGIVTAVITVTALFILRKIEKNISILLFQAVTISTNIFENVEETLASIFSEYGLHIQSIDYEKDHHRGEFIFNFNVVTRNRDAIRKLFLRLSSLDFVNSVKIKSS
jgi:putative Mg2+ transporter-C (MgtC) family protein